jgi:hypothetical protein
MNHKIIATIILGLVVAGLVVAGLLFPNYAKTGLAFLLILGSCVAVFWSIDTLQGNDWK